mgnify:CR=1 FL=1
MSQCIRERPKRSIFHNRTSNTGGQGLNRQYHDGGAEAPWQLHAPRRKTLTVGTKIGRDRSLDRAVLPRLSKGLSLEGRASRAPEARRAAGGATGDCAKAFKSRPSERGESWPLSTGSQHTWQRSSEPHPPAQFIRGSTRDSFRRRHMSLGGTHVAPR